MEVRHNTKLLERAVELVVQRAGIPTRAAEAAAAERQARAAARRRLATGAAVALAAVGIGLGVMLGFWRREPDARIAEVTPPKSEPATRAASVPPERQTIPQPPAPKPEPPAVPPSSTTAGGPITVDFTKFAKREVKLLGKTWQLTAGHHYDKATDANWKQAWCYSSAEVEKVSVRIELVERPSPAARPIAPIASRETLEKVGLDDAAAIALATYCPWLDERSFRVDDFDFPPGRDPKLDLEKPTFQLSGRTLIMRGAIAADLSKTLARYDFDRLQVSSPGGLVVEAMAAGEALRAGGKAVEVGAECLSACVLLLAGGQTRSALQQAKIGVHRFYGSKQTYSPRDIEVSQVLSSEIIRYLDRMGVDQALFHAMAAVPSNDMAYIPHDTLRRWRLLSPISVATTTPPLPPPVEIPRAPTPTGAEVFETRDGFDAMGGDLPNMPLRVELAGCEEKCRENDACAGFTYNKTAKACFLKSRIGTLFPEEVGLTGFRPSRMPMPQLARLQIRKRKGVLGEVLSQRISVPYVECALGCEDNTLCRGFLYAADNKQCVYFKTVTSDSDMAGVVSGVKAGL